MIIEELNALERADVSPAEAETPCGAEIQQGRKYGVPPSGGGAHAHTMIIEELNALERVDVSPAEAGTPCGAEIQQGRKYGVAPSGGRAHAHTMTEHGVMNPELLYESPFTD